MSSCNKNILNIEAKLVKSAACKVNTFLRPYPSLFYYPGLTSHHVWTKELLKYNQNYHLQENMNKNIDHELSKNYSNILNLINKLEENYELFYNDYKNCMMKNINLQNNYSLINNEHKLHKGEWIWYNYITKGKKDIEFNKNFPFTYEFLESFKGILIEDIPFAYSFYSLLKDKTEIEHHYGPCNIRLRIHLGIDIPDNSKNEGSECKVEISGKDYFWENGKAIIFDDTYIHSVVNKSGKNRIILLLDVWHPDLYDHEKKALINVLQKGQDMINKRI